MTRYLLDTNVCIDLMRGRSRRVFDRMSELAVDEVGLSSISLAELIYGDGRSQRPVHNLEQITRFCMPMAVENWARP